MEQMGTLLGVLRSRNTNSSHVSFGKLVCDIGLYRYQVLFDRRRK